MTSSISRWKLIIFGLITSLTAAYILIDFAQVPQALGIGRYQVSVELPAANGLYKKSVVTYRGVDVGAVTDLHLTDDGIEVELSIDNDVKIPADLTAEVHSTSAIGEQYVNLVPDSAGGPMLRAGDVIPVSRTKVPVSTSDLLDNTRALIDSVPLKDLATTSDQLSEAVGQSSQQLALLLDSGIEVEAAAAANVDPTVSLLESLKPVLATQQQDAGEIRSYTDDLAAFTGTLAASDQDLRSAIKAGPAGAAQLRGLFTDLTPVLPPVLTDLGLTADVLKAYTPAIEHTLIVLPAVIVAIENLVPASRKDDKYVEGNLNIKLNINDPPVCTDGFADARNHRDPNDMRPAALPVDSYCKAAHNDPRVVRGVRNFPCPNDPTRRSPTAAGCGLVFQDFPAPGTPTAKPTQPATGSILLPPGVQRDNNQVQFLLSLMYGLRG